MKNIKNTFFYNLWDNILKYLLAAIILIWIFHDGCPRNDKVVQMKEDVIYIKPNK